MSNKNELTLRIGEKKLAIMRLESKPSGDYMFFPITRDGLHYSVHPTGNPHLRNGSGQLAELDREALQQITVEDFLSLFKYPKHDRDVQVFPITDSLTNVWLGDAIDIPSMITKLFEGKMLFVMRARRLPEFFASNPGNYIVIDPKDERKIMMQFKGNPFGPMNIDSKTGPRNPKMKNLFSINLGILNALDKIPEKQLEGMKPDEFTISQWGAIIKSVLEQVRIVRWKKGGHVRSLGTFLNYRRR